MGDVARALGDLQRSALGLAVEQAALRRNVAESYVNLGRRNQNLLSRLLDSVGELERGETEPDRLDQLYRLEHLANRIRRNAESLLVLSEPVAPARWRPPVQVADVVRAALGEIENYERVVVRTLEPAMVRGGSSTDLAHILAELIENALRHSPPRELVEVSGHIGDAGYDISVVDHGLGMTPGRRGAGQPAPGRRRVVHGHARPLHGPLRHRGAGGPPRHLGPAPGLGGGGHHRPGHAAHAAADGPRRPSRRHPPRRTAPTPSPTCGPTTRSSWSGPPPHDVRAAVTLLRTRAAAPAREPVPAGMRAAAAERGRAPPLARPLGAQPAGATRAALGPAGGRAPGPPGERDVRPHRQRAGAAGADRPARRPAPRSRPRPEMERFLTSLAGRTPPVEDPDGPREVTMLDDDARNFNWLLDSFVEETAGVTDAMAVSSDGLLIASSETLDCEESDLLCAIIAGSAGMADGRQPGPGRGRAGAGHHLHGARLPVRERRRRRELPRRGGDPRVRRGLDRLPDDRSGEAGR